MKMQIEAMPPYRVAYLRQIGPYGSGNAEMMENLKQWARTNRLLHSQSVILGLAHDNPEITKAEACRYDVCLVIAGDYNLINGGVNEEQLPGGDYAVFQISHTVEAIRQAWQEIFPELTARGCQIDASRPVLERYSAGMVNHHFCEICVPIK